MPKVNWTELKPSKNTTIQNLQCDVCHSYDDDIDVSANPSLCQFCNSTAVIALLRYAGETPTMSELKRTNSELLIIGHISRVAHILSKKLNDRRSFNSNLGNGDLL